MPVLAHRSKVFPRLLRHRCQERHARMMWRLSSHLAWTSRGVRPPSSSRASGRSKSPWPSWTSSSSACLKSYAVCLWIPIYYVSLSMVRMNTWPHFRALRRLEFPLNTICRTSNVAFPLSVPLAHSWLGRASLTSAAEIYLSAARRP